MAGRTVLAEELGPGRDRVCLAVIRILARAVLVRHPGLPRAVTDRRGKEKCRGEQQPGHQYPKKLPRHYFFPLSRETTWSISYAMPKRSRKPWLWLLSPAAGETLRVGPLG